MRLKKKMQLYNTYISYYLSQPSFRVFYLISVLIAIYGSLISKVPGDLFDGFFAAFGYPTFIASYFLLVIVNTLMFNKFLDKASVFHDIRINNKTIILKEKILMSILLYLYFNIMFAIIIFPLIYLFKGGYIGNSNYYNYNVSKCIYSLYAFIRIIIFSSLLTALNVILYYKYRLRVIYLDFLILLGFRLVIRGDIFKFTLNIYNLLLFSRFISFKYDLLSTIIIISIFLVLCFLLTKNINKINFKLKSIMVSDFKFIMNRRINYLIVYLILHILIFLLYRNVRGGYDLFLGLNFKFSNFNIISFLTFTFSEITYIFILIKLLEKDMEYMYSVIFSRLNISKWFLSKICSFLIIVFTLKVIDYTMFYLIFNVSLSLVFRYLFVEILNILLIEVVILIISLFKKKKYLYFMLFILMIILLPKNIVSLYDYRYIIISIFLVFNCIMYLISRFRNNTIFNLIGGSYDRNKKYC